MRGRFTAAVALVSALIGSGCASRPPNQNGAPPATGMGGIETSASSTPSDIESPTEAPLEQAIQGSDVLKIQELLAKGTDPNTKTHEGMPVLFLTMDKKTPEIAKALLDKGARIDATDPEGETLLMAAVLNSNTELARLLLDYHADPNQQDRDGDLPLVMATAQEDSDLVKLLLERGANPKAVDKEGDTALRVATRNENPELIRLLNHPAAPSSLPK